MAQTTLVLRQAEGYVPVSGKAAWVNRLGGRGITLQAGTEVTVSDAVLDTGADVDTSSFYFESDIEEDLEFRFLLQYSSLNQSEWQGPGGDSPHSGMLYSLYQVIDSVVQPELTGTYTLRIPAGRYTAAGLADLVGKATRAPAVVYDGATVPPDSNAYYNDFFVRLSAPDANNGFLARFIGTVPGTTPEIFLRTGKTYMVGSNQGLGLSYDEITGRFYFGYLHTPVTDPAAPGEGIGILFDQSADKSHITPVWCESCLEVTQWTTKADWTQTLWYRLGFTQEQLSNTFRTTARQNISLTGPLKPAAGQFVPTPLTGAYDSAGVDRSFAEGVAVNNLSPVFTVRVREIMTDWRRADAGEGSLARITRSYAAAGFVFGQGSRTYTLTQDVTLQSIHVDILDEEGTVTSVLGSGNSITLEIQQPGD